MLFKSLFWFVLFSKPVFWVFLSPNYALGTLLWVFFQLLLLFFGAYSKKFCFSVAFDRVWWGYLAYAFVCVLGGVGRDTVSLFYGMVLFLPLLFALVFFDKNYSSDDLIKSIAIGGGGAMVLMAALVLLLGQGGLSSRDSGLGEIGPNTLGFIAALSSFVSFFVFSSSLRGRVFWKIFGGGGFVILAMTVSKTSVIALLVAMFFTVNALDKYYIRRSLFLVLAAVLLFSDYFFVIYDRFASGEINLTGRTILWAGILDYVKGSAVLFGYGYNSSADITKDIGFGIFGESSFTHAHNSYFEIYVNSGLVGLFFFLLVIVFFLKFFFQVFAQKNIKIIRGIFVILLVRSITEASISQPGSSDSVLFFVLFLFCSSRMLKKPEQPMLMR